MSAAKYGPGFHADVPELDYHADRGSLSQSGAKTMLKSPAKFRYDLDNPTEPSEAMQLGTLVHTEVLGNGQRMHAIPKTGRAKADQEAHAEAKAHALAEGLIPVTQERAEQVWAMGAAVLRHRRAASLLTEGAAEITAYGEDPETGVMRRARFDYLRDDLAVDLKTTSSRTADEFAKSCATFGYHQQHPWYVDIAADLGQPVRSLVFITVTSTKPYEVAVYELDHAAIERGRELNERALRLYKHCTETDDWSGATDIRPLRLPGWAFYDNQEIPA